MTRITFFVLLLFPLIMQQSFSQAITFKLENNFFAANPSPSNPWSNCEADVSLKFKLKGQTLCEASDSLFFEIAIDKFRNGSIDYLATSFCDITWVDWTLDIEDNIYKKYISPTNLNEIDIELHLRNQEIQWSDINWTIKDVCGTELSDKIDFSVVDKKAPTPYCVNIFTINFYDGRPVEITAKDFDKGSFDNCTPQSELIFTFDDVYPVYNLIDRPHYFKTKNGWDSIEAQEEEYCNGNTYKWNPVTKSASKIIKYEPRNSNRVINMSVFDSNWSSDYCTIVLYQTIVCNFPILYRFENKSVKEKPIKDFSLNVHESGIYEIDCENFEEKEHRYEIKADNGYVFWASRYFLEEYEVEFNADYADNNLLGIDTEDLRILRNHINGSRPFQHYWQYLAADLNEDKKIDELDIADFRKILSGEESTRWKTIPPFQEKTVENWINIKETFSYEDLDNYYNDFATRPYKKINLTSIKMGDLNADVFDLKPNLEQVDTSFFVSWRGSEREILFSPNPFKIQTQIELNSNKEGNAQIEVIDLQGRQVLKNNINVTKGKNLITINRDELPLSGIYICKMHLDNVVSSHKIVVLD